MFTVLKIETNNGITQLLMVVNGEYGWYEFDELDVVETPSYQDSNRCVCCGEDLGVDRVAFCKDCC